MIIEAAITTSALFVLIVLGSLRYNPRLWIQDFPEEIQVEMEPLSKEERLTRLLMGGLLLVVVVGIPLVSVLSLKPAGEGITFLEGFLHIWLIFMVVNLVDLVLIDCVIGIWWQPEFLSTPELESLRQHLTVRFHIIEHLKGTVLLTVLALGLAVLVSL